LIETAEALADTLARENAALRGLDLAAAAALYPRKDAAITALTAAQAQLPESMTTALDAEQQRLARELAERLRALVEENRRLLRRAIEVQGHVLGTVARAVAQASPRAQPPRYGARGTLADARRQPPVMLSSRA
jgi:flagellar biosynthesis/type III secretory pathway chaperone